MGLKKSDDTINGRHCYKILNKQEIVFLSIFPFTVILMVYHKLVNPSLFFDNGNFINPYLYGSPFYFLSQQFPWSSMIWVGLFRIQYTLPWFSPNTVYLYITSTSSLTFFIFLSGLKLGRIPRLFGGLASNEWPQSLQIYFCTRIGCPDSSVLTKVPFLDTLEERHRGQRGSL